MTQHRVTHQPLPQVMLIVKPARRLTLMALLRQVGYVVTKNLLDNVFMANNLDNAASTSSSVNEIDAGASLSSDLDRTSASGR